MPELKLITIDESFFTSLLVRAQWCAAQGMYEAAASYARTYAEVMQSYQSEKRIRLLSEALSDALWDVRVKYAKP